MMRKAVVILVLILTILLSSMPALAAGVDGPWEGTYEISPKGGTIDCLIAQVSFKKNYLETDETITYKVKVYAEDGVPYIDIEPSVKEFKKKVTIQVSDFTGELYDIKTGQNVLVSTRKHKLKVKHFSRYILSD